LTWGEVCQSEQRGYYLQFKQQKTGGAEFLPISEQAFGLLGERRESNAPAIEGLVYSAWENAKLKKWLLAAGITKELTFHGFRHTYATLQLTLGTDIYTVSKMLGHRDLKTTQVYAKIVDETKRAAADKIKLNL
jgi:integrase